MKISLKMGLFVFFQETYGVKSALTTKTVYLDLKSTLPFFAKKIFHLWVSLTKEI